MCRIVGSVSLENANGVSQVVEPMMNSMTHGGPDGSGIYHDKNLVLGHRRLAILDLTETGQQPMVTSNESHAISFNGQIYNHQELRNELSEHGVAFRSTSDTEVLLNAFKFWGPAIFNRLEGIFAFAIYEKHTGRLFLVRDHFGVKPLYYHLQGGELLFASEVKAFLESGVSIRENIDWKVLFLAFGSLPHPHTTLAGVYSLAPGSYMEYNTRNFTYDIRTYYEGTTCSTMIHSEHEALRVSREAIRNSVKKNLVADVPIGVFLSGGIDSSIITLVADSMKEHIRSLSVNFEEKSFDESEFQNIVLEKTKSLDHVFHRVTETMFWEQLPDFWKAMDQPSIDGVNSYFISRCAKMDGLKTVLSGVGADELFGGYASFHRVRWIRMLRLLPGKKILGKILGLCRNAYSRIVFLEIKGPVGDYLFLRGIHTPNGIAELLNLPVKQVMSIIRKINLDVHRTGDDLQYASDLESKVYLTNQILKDADAMGMWHGIEVRTPFLDIALVQKVRGIASRIRFLSGKHKFLLTNSYKDILSPRIAQRKKQGFTFPFSIWMKRHPDFLKTLLPFGKPVDKLVAEFNHGHDHWSKIWSMVVIAQLKIHGNRTCEITPAGNNYPKVKVENLVHS